ncbi:hypothetical protein [Isoalcanivorax beigongshangi]|uniref:Secreted protein n=1 Tax=Isoalcanivorax beigongshangi TaxID=3238810 RepID=A0ABV4AFE7_9GAMM
MKKKLLASVLVGGGVALFSAGASASYWEEGTCAPDHVDGPAPCIQATDEDGKTYFFNGDGAHAGDWHGRPDTGSPFTFKGSTDLKCGVAALSCDLALNGNVRKDFDPAAGEWKIGIQVTSANVTGSVLCSAVTVKGFPWYVDQDANDGPYTSAVGVGIPYTYGGTPAISFMGSIGPIGISVPLLGINVNDGHMHKVFYNNQDTFSFGGANGDSTIYNSSEGSTGCTVSGDLKLQPPMERLEILPL